MYWAGMTVATPTGSGVGSPRHPPGYATPRGFFFARHRYQIVTSNRAYR